MAGSVAWWGLAALAVPILIHLLVRQESRRLLFPSLRFLRTTAVASWRRKFVTDWPLLLVRLADSRGSRGRARGTDRPDPGGGGTVATADGASDRRRRPIERRPARRRHDVPIRPERESSAFAATFVARPLVADALRDAVTWLEAQPPAGRESVIVSEVRNGAITAGDLAVVPEHVGVRFSVLPRSLRTGRQW